MFKFNFFSLRLAEFGGFEFNIQEVFPSHETRCKFIREYIAMLLCVEDVESVDDDIIAGFEVNHLNNSFYHFHDCIDCTDSCKL